MMSFRSSRSQLDYTHDGLFPIEVEGLLHRLGLDELDYQRLDVLPQAPPGYILESELGRGGMGIVYRAAQTRLNRTVAIKMIRFVDRHDRTRNRFFLEAETLALIQHPNVVPIYDFGDSADNSFLVLEYLPGGNLSQRLQTHGPLAVPETLVLLRTLALAVQALHDVGIVHRDLKPSNILFSADGTPKIADFGLAKRPTMSQQTANDQTATLSYLGTPAYMSPEQAEGRTRFVSAESDIYSLGVILFECLTGHKPFWNENPWQLMRQIVDERPPLVRRLRPDLPRGVELIVQKCLEKQPHRRYPTAECLARDLLALAEGRRVQAKPSGTLARALDRMRSHPLQTALGAVTLLTGVGLVAAIGHSYQTRSELRHQKLLSEQHHTHQLLAEETVRLREAESRLARVDASRAEELAELLASMFHPTMAFPTPDWPQLVPWEIARQTTAEDLLADAVRRLDSRWVGDPLTRAKVRLVLGESLLANGSFEDARPNLEESWAVRREHLPADHADVSRSEYALARFWDETGDYAKAVGLYRHVEQVGSPTLRQKARCWRLYLAIALEPDTPSAEFEKRLQACDDPMAQSLGWLHLARRHRLLGDAAAAQRAIQHGQHSPVPAPWAERFTLESVRVEQMPPCDPASQIPLVARLQRSIEQIERTLGENTALAALARSELAALTRGPEADELYQTVANDLRRTVSLAHPETLPHVVGVAQRDAALHQPTAARAILEEAGRAYRERYRHDNAHTVAWLIERALLEDQLGEPNAAAGYTEEVVQMLRRTALWLPLATLQRRNLLATRLRQHSPHTLTADQLQSLGTVSPGTVLANHD